MLRKLLHKTLYSGLVLYSFLPLRLLYFFSTISYLLLYDVLRYRRVIVEQNIQLAFPEMDAGEKKQLVKKFYIDFCDHFFETIKLISMSKEKLHSMFEIGFDEAEQLNRQGRSCYILLGHQFNWELANAYMTSLRPTRHIVAYLPAQSEFFNHLIVRLRARFGAVLTPSNKLIKGLYPYRNETYNLVLMADQNPGEIIKSYWLPFFNNTVPFFKGPEKGARAGNTPVVFMDIEKIKRGKYKIRSFLISAEPKLEPESNITRTYVAKLEESIRRSPATYLWSHRRWRHKQEDDIAVV